LSNVQKFVKKEGKVIRCYCRLSHIEPHVVHP
jgi:hypothetical protein